VLHAGEVAIRQNYRILLTTNKISWKLCEKSLTVWILLHRISFYLISVILTVKDAVLFVKPLSCTNGDHLDRLLDKTAYNNKDEGEPYGLSLRDANQCCSGATYVY
jgi:hypothetical protein